MFGDNSFPNFDDDSFFTYEEPTNYEPFELLFLEILNDKNNSNEQPPNEEEEEEEEQKEETIPILKKRIKKPKTKVELTFEGKQLQDSIYNLIKNKKDDRVLKQCIFSYHKKAMENDCRVTTIKLEENRNVNIYFNNHSGERLFIIEQYKQMQDNGIINYEIDRKKYSKL